MKLKNIIKIISSATFSLMMLSGNAAYAGIVEGDNPNTFIDTTTGKTWLSMTETVGYSVDMINASLESSTSPFAGYRVATYEEVHSLLSGINTSFPISTSNSANWNYVSDYTCRFNGTCVSGYTSFASHAINAMNGLGVTYEDNGGSSLNIWDLTATYGYALWGEEQVRKIEISNKNYTYGSKYDQVILRSYTPTDMSTSGTNVSSSQFGVYMIASDVSAPAIAGFGLLSIGLLLSRRKSS